MPTSTRQVNDGCLGVSFSRRVRLVDRVERFERVDPVERLDRVPPDERRALLVRGLDRLPERLREL